MGMGLAYFSLCNYCVTLMHHMMHWPLPNWTFLVQEALIPPIGICQPREACFCDDLSTSTSMSGENRQLVADEPVEFEK